MTTLNIENKARIIGMGGKEWVKNGMDRVYISCAILNVLRAEKELAQVNYSESSNKMFFDTEKNAVMRSYKGKAPVLELAI